MGTIADFLKRDKVRDFLGVLIIILVAVVSFGLGKLSEQERERGGERTPVRIEGAAAAISALDTSETEGTAPTPYPEGKFVASRNSDVFHFPWCPGAARISEANKVWYPSREAAEAAGLRPAANCKGLE